MARNVEVKILSDAAGFARGFKTAAADADSFGSKLSGKVTSGLKLAGAAALGLAGVVAGGLAVALKTGFGELQEAEAVLATSSTLIENLGKKTSITAGNIEEWAGNLQGMTGIPDDVIMSAENVLLKFDALAGDSGIFQRTTTLAADMSVALGKDMPAAATALGRALADPETAMGKLARMGVVLTDQQQKVIDKFVETGDTAGATEYLLGLLEKKFGGVAEAAGDTTSGKIEIMKRKFEEMSEALASRLLPHAERFIDWLSGIMDSGSVGEALGKIGSSIGEIAGNIADFIGNQDWGHIGGVVGEKLAAVIKAVPWGAIVKGAGKLLWGALSGAFSAGVEILNEAGVGQAIRDYLAQEFEDAMDVMVPIADKFMGAIQLMLEGLGRLPDALGGAKFDKWAEAVGDAREDLRDWNHELEEAIVQIHDVGDGFVRVEDVQQHAFDVDGIEGLATHLAALERPFDNVTLATMAWTAAMGDVPDIVQVNALLEDDEARAAIQSYIARIGDIPEDHESRAKLLAEAAIDLAAELKGAIERVPDDHKTNVSAPGAKESEKDVDAVDRAVRNMKDSKTARVNVTGDSYVIDRLSTVNALAQDVSKTVTTYYRDEQLPQGTTGENALGTDFWRGGLTWVGEQGPELVSLPRGSAVYPHGESMAMARGGSPIRGGGGGDVYNVYIPNYLGDKRELMAAVEAGLRLAKQRNGSAVGV